MQAGSLLDWKFSTALRRTCNHGRLHVLLPQCRRASSTAPQLQQVQSAEQRARSDAQPTPARERITLPAWADMNTTHPSHLSWSKQSCDISCHSRLDTSDVKPGSTATTRDNETALSSNSQDLDADERRELDREHLLAIMVETSSANDAWEAYDTLCKLDHGTDGSVIPVPLLHRLARLLASSKPRTRTLFLRLSAVLTAIQDSGGQVFLWQWNALIDCAGKHWRKTRPEDYMAALDIFNGMLAYASQGKSADPTISHDSSLPFTQPDIITYTTLLHIASLTLRSDLIRHATSLLESSGALPNRITHLSLLSYYTRTNQIPAVRATMRKMQEQGMDIGIDGVNACLWAYARNGHLDVASTIYRVLRHNVKPEESQEGQGEADVNSAAAYLRDIEGLTIPSSLIPDEKTYNAMIQSLAYQGDLIRALQVFVDMLSTPNMDSSAPCDSNTAELPLYHPTLPAFRGIFLGFVRHAREPHEKGTAGLLSNRLKFGYDPSTPTAWNLDNLHAVFNAFLNLPPTHRPSSRTIYWVLVAFGKASGHDSGKLRKVWKQLDAKFGGVWDGRVERLRASIFAPTEK